MPLNTFIHSAANGIDSEIKRSLQTLGEFLGVDRCFANFYSIDLKRIEHIYEWCATGIEPLAGKITGLSVEPFSWSVNKLKNFENFYFPTLSSLPPEGKAEKEFFRALGFKSFLAIPLILEKSLIGFFGFSSEGNEKLLKEEDFPLLKMVGEIFVTLLKHKHAEEALINSRNYLDKIINSIADPIFVKDSEHHWILLNDAYCNLVGFKKEELLGKSDYDFYKKNEADIFWEKDELVLRTGKENINEEPLTDASGDFHIIFTKKTLYVDKAGNKFIVGIISDVTERKKTEEELRKAKEDSEVANRVKSEFLATVSHELRTPLNGVIGALDLLLGTELNPAQQKFTEIARLSAASLLSVIKDILDFSKIEAGKLEIEEIEFDLKRTVAETMEIFDMKASKKGLVFTFLIKPDVPSFLIGDPGRLRQILINLCSNAIKFTEKGGVFVCVNTENENVTNATIRFTVNDTGIGIPEKHRGHLFKSFSQLDSSTTRKYGGTGLGLAISKHLSELMDGQIGVESEEGKGSKFWFTTVFTKRTADRNELLKDEETDKPRIMSEDDNRKNRNSIRILLAEDNLTSRYVALNILENHGYLTDAVKNGKEVLAALEKTHYDLILMDLQMPEMDRFETISAIRRKERETGSYIPIITITAHPMKDNLIKFIETSIDDYISKPVNPKILIKSIERILNNLPPEKNNECSEKEQNDVVFDASAFLERLDGNMNIFSQTMDLCLEDLTSEIEKLKEAIQNNDSGKIYGIAHTMKGLAMNVSANALNKVADEIESTVKEGDLNRLDSLVEKLCYEFKRLRNVVKGGKYEENSCN